MDALWNSAFTEWCEKGESAEFGKVMCCMQRYA
jgi:hypothetical protein